jgi:membrane fusion protein (multidrug efflux system)
VTVRTRISSPAGRRDGAWTATGAALVFAALGAAGCQEKQAPPPAAPPEVVVTSVVQQDVPIQMELVGQTKGSQDVEIRARVEGFLEDVAFTEGSVVRKGQVLYRIDRKPLEATLANSQADLATAQARLSKTTNDVNRYRPLVAQQAVSQQELDNAISAQTAAQAQVEAQKAKVEQSKIDLGYTTVTSPIDGMVGTTLVKAGNLVGRGDATLLTTISELDPILFRAGISEAEYLRLSRRVDELRKERGGAAVPINLVLADGTVHPHPGRLDVIERAVDATTGTLTIQFKFPNPGGLIRPGQYGRAQFVLETRKGALLVPQRAVQELQNLYNVAVVGSDNTVSMKNVTVGPRVGNLWVIEKGLAPTDRVIVEGLQRVRPGSPVTPKMAAPAASDGAAKATDVAAGEGK